MKILVPGRWQPLHVGHIGLINQVSEYGQLIIGIGDVPPGPFTYEERRLMFKKTLPHIDSITYLQPDDFNLWPKVDMIATGNLDLALSLREYELAVLLLPERRVKRVNSEFDFVSGTLIRDRLNQNQSITGMVSPQIEDLIYHLWKTGNRR